MSSTRSSNRARINQRGFVLIAALALAILYFALMELILIDSSRALAEAQRYRSKVIANALAENAAELAAVQMVHRSSSQRSYEDQQGVISGQYTRSGSDYILSGEAATAGIRVVRARVEVQGRVEGTVVRIDYVLYSQ